MKLTKSALLMGLGLAGLMLSAMPATAKSRLFPTDDKPALDDRYPDRVTHFAGGVTGLADVVYSVIPGYRPLIVDIYMPPKSAKPKPLIMYIHGGGWVSGHTRHSGASSNFPAALARLASEGFVVASLEYRLSGEAPFPAALQDSRAALRFLRANAGKYGIDSRRVGVWGGSAGGHLTALTATTCGETRYDPAPPKGAAAPTAGSECVQGAVTWYGVFDFAPMMARPGGDGAGRKLLGCAGECSAEAVASVSPITHVTKQTPPFLLIHGNDDKTVSVAQSHAFEAKLKETGVPVEAIYIPGVDHSFIGKTAAETHAATNQALNATFDYFHRLFDRP